MPKSLAVSVFFRTFVLAKMTKDEIIFNLMEQLKAANEQIAKQSVHIASLTAQIAELTARLRSIEQSFKAKDDSLKKEQRKNK